VTGVNDFWTVSRIETIKRETGYLQDAELAKAIGVSKGALRTKQYELGLLLRLPKRPLDAYHRYEYSTKVLLDKGYLKHLEPMPFTAEGPWSTYDLRRTQYFYGLVTVERLAKALGRSPDAVRAKVHDMNWDIGKSFEYRRNARGVPNWLRIFNDMRTATIQLQQEVA